MQCVIMAGGAGTRLSEETINIPKPMVEIGGRPILWHIMKLYSYYGINDFIICCGYKGYMIKEYFANYYMHNCDVTVSTKEGIKKYHKFPKEEWNVTLVDTGENTFTGERLKQVQKYIDSDSFMLTYGDGVADVDIKKLLEFHESHGKIGTCTAVKKASRFGSIKISNKNKILNFHEKPIDDNSWINGGFFVFNNKIFDYVDIQMLEQSTLPRLTKHNHLMAYKHEGFWKPMDTLRDKSELETMWKKNPKWKVW